MRTVADLLDKCRETCSLASDNALAKKLGVTRQAVSGWRRGNSQPDTVSCDKIAEICAIPLQRVLGIVGEARAIGREEKAVWRKLASIAAAIVIGFMALLAPTRSYATSHNV